MVASHSMTIDLWYSCSFSGINSSNTRGPNIFNTQYNMTLYIYQSRSWNESTLWIEQDIVKEGCLETPDTLHPITPLMASQCWLTLGNCFRDVSGVVYDFVYLFSYQTCLHLAFETSAHLVLVGNHVRLHSLFFSSDICWNSDLFPISFFSDLYNWMFFLTASVLCLKI